MRVAVFSYRYLVERSPAVTGIVRFLVESGAKPTFLVDTTSQQLPDALPGAYVIQLIPRPVSNVISKLMSATSRLRAVPLIGPRIRRFTRKVLASLLWLPSMLRLRRVVYGFDLLYCIEAQALFMLRFLRFPLKRCIYVSLELQQVAALFGLRRAGALIKECAIRLIQSPERGKLLNRAIRWKLEYRYVPVSTVPRVPSKSGSESEVIRIVYSGYLAKWSLLREFLIVYRAIERETNLSLTIHGHSIGTETYAREIRKISRDLKTVSFDETPLSDHAHQTFLDRFDIGIAFYRVVTDNDNWKGLLRSSGKIATYLWSGLAVITNIDEPDTRCAPFFYVNELSRSSLMEALEAYLRTRGSYPDESVSYAHRHYNVYRHLEPVHTELLNSGLGLNQRQLTRGRNESRFQRLL